MKFEILKKLKGWFKNLIKNEPSLAEIVKKEKKINKPLEKILKFNTKNLWLPTGELFIVTVIFLIFLFLSHFQSFPFFEELIICIEKLWLFDGNFIVLSGSGHHQNLIAIHSGIGAVLIGLAFFIAQELTKGNPYKGLALLRRSRFFPLLVAEILFFFQFLWGSLNFLSIIPIVFIGLCTIYSLYESIKLIANNFSLKKHEEEIFYNSVRSKFLQTLNFETIKIIGDNKLNEKIKEFGDFVHYSPINKEDYIKIKSSKSGTLTDIRFNKLKKLLLALQAKSSNNHSNFSEDSTKKTQENFVKQEPYIHISARFYSRVKQEESVLAWIRKDVLFDDYDQKIVQKIFEIKDHDFDYEEARNEILKVKARCVELINNQSSDDLNKTINLYLTIIKDFYEYLNLYGGGFSQKQAQDMQKSIAFGEFNAVDWIAKDIKEIFDLALSTKSIPIIGEVIYAPIKLMQYAVDYKDHLIFQQFQHYPRIFYVKGYEALNNGDKEIGEYLLDRSWRYLTEFCDYHLKPKLEEKTYPEKEFNKFATSVLRVFQNLIKDSFDKRDIKNFENFTNKANGLFKNLILGKSRESRENKVWEELNQKKQEMFFGLSSWIFFKLESDKSLKPFFEKITQFIPQNIIDLTNVFLKAHYYDREESWGWSDWEREGREGVISIRTLEKLEKLYAIQSLKALQSKNDQEIEKIELPHTRELAFLAEGTRDLLKILDDMKANPDNWKFVFNNQIPKVDKFKELLEKAKKAQDQYDLQRKRDATISPKKIEEFKKNVVKNFYESHGIRNVLNYYGLVEDKSDKPYEEEIKKIGINTMFDKAPFFDESVKWHVHFMGDDNGFDFGRSLINGENNEIIKKIQENLSLVNKEEFNNQLNHTDLTNTMIISLNGASWEFFEDSKKSKDYIPKWQLEMEKTYPAEIAGIYKFQDQEIPVYEIYDSSKSKAILVLEKNNLGKIVQYSPLDKDESEDLQEDIFYMDVGIFTDDSDSMEKYLNDPPDWLKEVGEKKAQKSHLKERVVIKIFERFEFQSADKIIGFQVQLEEK